MASMTGSSLRCASSLRSQLASPSTLHDTVACAKLNLSSVCPRGLRLKKHWQSEFSGRPELLLHDPTEVPAPSRGFFTVTAKQRNAFLDLIRPAKESSSNAKRLQPGKLSPPREVPPHIPRPSYAESGVPPPFKDTELQIHDREGIEKMRAAGKLAADVRDYAGTLVKPGVTTDFIDKEVHRMITEAGAYPSPLNYGKFPKSVCTSVNECICHGIPDSRPLEDGDIINIDVTVYLNGYHGDTSATFFCGNVSPEARRLVSATKEALDAAIAICAPGVPYNKIGKTIQAIGDKYKLGVVSQYVGHGVGQIFHSGPTILHNRNNKPGVMVKNQTFTIEPMFTIGSPRDRVWSDNWTAVTVDGSWSAQFEHTLLITDNGVEVLTKP